MQEQLYGLLSAVTSEKKEEREAAEAQLESEWMCRPAVLLPALIEILAHAPSPVVLPEACGLSDVPE